MDKVQIYDPRRHYNQRKSVYDKNISDVLSHGRFINGPEIEKLENVLSSYVKVKHGVGVSSGTDALLIALMAVGVKSGDEVVTVPFSWISTAEVIKLLGAKPIFCDIDHNSFNMDTNLLSDKISKKTKVVMPVSIFGQVYDVVGVRDVVREAERRFGTKIRIIEDAAQSFGAEHKEGYSCSVADIGCTSFFPSKPLGCFGDGGMCFTDDDELASIMRTIRNHGCQKRYHYERVGINGRLDTLQAAILLSKTPDMDDQFNKRDDNARFYDNSFKDLPVRTPGWDRGTIRHVYAQYTIQLLDEKTRDNLKNYLEKNGVGSAVFYPVQLHLVPVITKEYLPGSLVVAESMGKKVLSLPCYPELTRTERQKVIDVVTSFFQE